jgi:hypothetical protein
MGRSGYQVPNGTKKDREPRRRDQADYWYVYVSRDPGDHSAKQGDPEGITKDRKVIQSDPRNTTIVYKK